MSSARRWSSTLVITAALTLSARPGNVVLVSGSGFTLQSAIDAAAEGDTLLIAPGSYYSANITAKSLSLVADPSGGATLTVGVRVTNLGAAQRCVIGGLVLNGDGGYAAIEIRNDVGSVRLQSIQATPTASRPGAIVENSSDVAFERCTIHGGAQPSGGSGTPPPPGIGIDCTGSQVALYDCAITGGRGRDGQIVGFPITVLPAQDGAPGVRATNAANLFVRGTMITGGAGGNGSDLFCHNPANIAPTSGANGVVGLEVDASTAANAIDATILGGAGGIGGSGGGPCTPGGAIYGPGADGSSGAAISGPLNVQAGAHLTLVAADHVREAQVIDVAVTGTPGDTAYLALSTQSRWALDLSFGGVFLYGPTARRVRLGTIPAGGTLSVSLPVAALPAGVQAARYFLQFAARDPITGHVELASPSVLMILDSSF